MFLELLIAALLMGGDCDDNHDSGFSSRPRRSTDFEFEEADSFFGREGNEHFVDDDGYCEDCDDYHDDW